MSFPSISLVPPTLSNWQMSYNGLVMGLNTPYLITQLDGLDLPALRTGDVARPRVSGEFAGLDLLAGRDITITMSAMQDATSLQSALKTLATATVPPADGVTEAPLWIQLPGLPILAAMVRVRQRHIPIDMAWGQGLAQSIALLFHATDPRLYAPTTATTVSLPGTLGGLTFNATPNFAFGGGTTYGNIPVVNAGNIQSNPIITLTGPVTTPVITNATEGKAITIYNPSQGGGYTLNTGETLVIDTDSHLITYYASGSSVGSSRRAWLLSGSLWWDLPPGGTSYIEFSSADASQPSPVPTCTITYAPAYISAT